MRPIIVLTLLAALIAAQTSQGQVPEPGDFNGNGSVDVADLIFLVNSILPFYEGPLDTGTYVWQVGDLNDDGVYHTVADWWQLPLEITAGSDVPDNPPEPYYLDSIIVGDAVGAPGDSVRLPLYGESVENLSGVMIQMAFDSLYLRQPELSSGTGPAPSYQHIEAGAVYIDYLFWASPLDTGRYNLANLHLKISEDVPHDTQLIVQLVSGDYYPSGFSNVSYPTYFITPILVNGTVYVRRTAISENHQPDEIGYRLTNFPNPFNSSTTIEFFLNGQSSVQIVIYDILGREIERPIEAFLSSGQHEIVWDAGSRPSGVYLYRLRVGDDAVTRRMTLLK